MKQLKKFENPEELNKFFGELNIYEGWKIEKGILNKRGESISAKSYVNYLRDMFNQKGFFRRSVSIAEIVSWIDSLMIMTKFCIKLKQEIPKKVFERIKIHMEYVIEYAKLMRIDYVIEYNNTFLLIDFRLVDSFDKIRPTWSRKKTELLIYKELIENYFEDKRIYTYALILLYEYDKKQKVLKHYEYNANQIQHMLDYYTDLVLKLAEK